MPASPLERTSHESINTMKTLLTCLLALAALAATAAPEKDQAKKGHAHTAPHGGTLVEVGDHQFNLEFLFDAERGVLQAWILDAHAENFVRVPLKEFRVVARAGGKEQALAFRAVANELSGETVGDTSQFEARAPWLREAKAFAGTVTEIIIRGARFADIRFRFPDNDDEHDHEHEKHDDPAPAKPAK